MPTDPVPTPAATGRPAAEVLAELRALRGADAPTRGGRTFAYVYDAGLDGLDELTAEAYTAFATVNGLDPTVFPSVARLENDLVRAAVDLLGVPGAQGTFTSGGTESILLAVKTARDHARAVRGVTDPSWCCPPPPTRPSTRPPTTWASNRSSSPSTRSPSGPTPKRWPPPSPTAPPSWSPPPSYAHGVVDPVAEIAAAASARGVLCHVDACIGGWLLPHLRRAGRDIPPFDLSVPGVTSLSVDLHKYGYADKGASVVLYRDAELRRHQYFAHAGWPGYPVVNPTVQGTKSGGLLAQAWAALQHVGEDGYTALAGRVAEASDRLLAGLRALPGLRVLGEPAAGLVAFTVLGGEAGGEQGEEREDGADREHGAPDAAPGEGVPSEGVPGEGASSEGVPDLSLLLHLADEMRELGWYLQPQLSFDGLPPNLHLTLTPATVGQVDALLTDLAKALSAARALDPVAVDPALAELAAGLDPDTLGPEEVAGVLAFAGLDGDAGLPGRMAPVLALLDALPGRLKERLLAEFIGAVFRV